MINLFADSYVVITPHLSGIEKCCVGGGNVMYRLMMRLCFVLDRILLNVVLSLLDARYVYALLCVCMGEDLSWIAMAARNSLPHPCRFLLKPSPQFLLCAC